MLRYWTSLPSWRRTLRLSAELLIWSGPEWRLQRTRRMIGLEHALDLG
jgi:hypothetical protein